jgi:hypothetical protein
VFLAKIFRATIYDRVWHKINSWNKMYLFKAGREILIKSILKAILTYVMSIFQLPITLITSIEKMMNSFWWGHGGSNSHDINWMWWKKLLMHKNYGGMGF